MAARRGNLTTIRVRCDPRPPRQKCPVDSDSGILFSMRAHSEQLQWYLVAAAYTLLEGVVVDGEVRLGIGDTSDDAPIGAIAHASGHPVSDL